MSKIPGILIPTKKFVFHAATTVDAFTKTAEAPAEQLVALRGPRDPLEVEAHKARYHLSEACANCVRWYEGRDRDLKLPNGEPACAAPGPCAGLPSRLGYPHYLGPFDDEYWKVHCVVCGDEAPKRVKTPDGKERGYCEAHLQHALSLCTTGKRRGL